VQAEQALKKDNIEKVEDIFGVGEEFDDDDDEIVLSYKQTH
jgi:hypothetical protein